MRGRPRSVNGPRPVVLAGGDVRPPEACARFWIRVRWGMDKRGRTRPGRESLQGGAASGRFGCVRCPAGLTRDLGVDAAHVGEVAGSGRAVRPSARAGLPAVVAGSLVAGLPGPIAIAAWALTPPRPGSPGGGSRGGAESGRLQAGCAAGRRNPSPRPDAWRPAARAGEDACAQPQAVIVAIGDASVMISTSWRESFAKARHMATSSQLSQVPCSSPVASSTTV